MKATLFMGALVSLRDLEDELRETFGLATEDFIALCDKRFHTPASAGAMLLIAVDEEFYECFRYDCKYGRVSTEMVEWLKKTLDKAFDGIEGDCFLYC